MSKSEKIREQINLNKFMMGLISVIMFSITGFVVSNYQTLPFGLMIFSVIIVISLLYVFTIIFSKTIEKIDKLEDL